jgi:hypothetical protein
MSLFAAKADAIRKLHYIFKLGYKQINRLCPMCEETYFDILFKRGAYK